MYNEYINELPSHKRLIVIGDIHDSIVSGDVLVIIIIILIILHAVIPVVFSI